MMVTMGNHVSGVLASTQRRIRVGGRGPCRRTVGFFTAAWFKVYLGGDTGAWHDLIYNRSNPASLCNYAQMTECLLDEK